jgi:hypothetical protein
MDQADALRKHQRQGQHTDVPSALCNELRHESQQCHGDSLVLVLHAAELANRQALAGGLKLRVAHVFALACFAALGSRFMGRSDGAMARNVFLGFLVTFWRSHSRYRKGSCPRKRSKRYKHFFHKFTLPFISSVKVQEH